MTGPPPLLAVSRLVRTTAPIAESTAPTAGGDAEGAPRGEGAAPTHPLGLWAAWAPPALPTAIPPWCAPNGANAADEPGVRRWCPPPKGLPNKVDSPARLARREANNASGLDPVTEMVGGATKEARRPAPLLENDELADAPRPMWTALGDMEWMGWRGLLLELPLLLEMIPWKLLMVCASSPALLLESGGGGTEAREEERVCRPGGRVPAPSPSLSA